MNSWYHLVATWSGTTATIYVNGASDGSNNSYNSANWTPTSIDIGRPFNHDTDYANGVISSVRIYNNALTSAEVAEPLLLRPRFPL